MQNIILFINKKKPENKMKRIFTIAATAAIAGLVGTGCGGTKQAAYQQPQQTQPNTVQQAQAANRGMKLDKEECEEKALEESANLREAGNGISDKESFAINLALLDARAKLAQQLEVLVNGLIRNFNQQHEKDGGSASVGKASGLQQGYFEQFLTNSRPICKNTYVREDGKYNVFVCVELGEQQKRAIHKKLTEDDKLSTDFVERQFMDEMKQAKEDYRQKQLQQQQ